MRLKENVLQWKINDNQSWNINMPGYGKQAGWARKEANIAGWLSQVESHCQGCSFREKDAQGKGRRRGTVYKEEI